MGLITEYFEYYLVVGADKQVIYWTERPTYSFPKVNEKRGNETIYKIGKVKWLPISVELPTRPLSFIMEWIEKKSKKNVSIQKINKDGKIAEEWLLQSVEISNVINRRSRVADLSVLNLILRYNWARKI